MTNWFISVNGEQKGPYPTDQLRQLVSDGFVARDVFVWREGMANWQPLSQVRLSDDLSGVSTSAGQASDGSSYEQATDMSSQAQGETAMLASGVSEKRILPLFLLFFFLAFLGVHRFYVGKIWTGILFIITLGGFGIWWIVDLVFIVVGGFTDRYGNKITQWT